LKLLKHTTGYVTDNTINIFNHHPEKYQNNHLRSSRRGLLLLLQMNLFLPSLRKSLLLLAVALGELLLRFSARLSLDFEPAKNATSWDFWLRNIEVSGSAALRSSEWDWNQSLTCSASALDKSNCVHHFTKACLYSDGNWFVLSVLL